MIGIPTLQLRLKQRSNCSGKRLHVRGSCEVVIALSAGGEDLGGGDGEGGVWGEGEAFPPTRLYRLPRLTAPDSSLCFPVL